MFISDTASYNLFIGILLVLLVNPNDDVGMYGQDLKVDTGLTVMSDWPESQIERKDFWSIFGTFCIAN